MDGLKTTRVLVVDDELAEARPFMEALAKRSIGSIYFSGTDVDKLPSEDCKLTGIRLAALDLDLGINGEAPAVIGALIEVLNRILQKENGPYLAIAWTSKDNTYFEEFQRRISELACVPINVIKMKKGVYQEIEATFAKVKESVEGSYPLGLLSYWEQIVHQSSGSVMEILPVPTESTWTAHSQQTLSLVLDAVSVANDSSVASLAALLSAFSSLQLDYIENDIASLIWEDASRLVSPLAEVHTADALDLKAELNYRLLCTKADDKIAPGNIYRCDELCSSEVPLLPTLDHLLDEMVSAKEELEKEEQKEMLKNAGCLPIAMEVTPLCDYQQDKFKLPRFVCGVALPYDERRQTKRPEGFLRTDNSPIAFPDCPLTGTKLLVWNSRYTVSVPKTMVNSEAGLIRLRQAPLVDIQAWLSSQLNRPGYVSLRVGW